MRSRLWLPAVFLLVLGLFVVETKGETLRVAWAEWPPADYLQELSKGFTEETGIDVDIVQIPWPSFQNKIDELLSQSMEL